MRKFIFLILCILLCSLSVSSYGAEKQTDITDAELKPIATITVEEMNHKLKTGNSDDILYVKVKDDRVEVYEGLATNRSWRKQLVLTLPNTEMLRLYTKNKATFEQINKMLSDYERANTNFNGYKIITDKDNPQKLENGDKVYRFWFMKIEREKASRRSGWGFPIGIGIGIGGHHHHHGGPWIGVGW